MVKRITYKTSFKCKVALEALKENKTLSDLAQEFKLHPSQITRWKTQVVKGISQIFDDRRKKSPLEVDVDALYAQIGKRELLVPKGIEQFTKRVII